MGKIEELKVKTVGIQTKISKKENNLFIYQLICKPEETHSIETLERSKRLLVGRLEHHGKYEVMRTTQTDQALRSQIIRKIKVLKMTEFLKVPFEEIETENTYVFRYHFLLHEIQMNFS